MYGIWHVVGGWKYICKSERESTIKSMSVTNQHIKQQPGFTIVELLIVIVVIAILAAISIVAYNGIQQRARDANRLNDAKNIEKSLRIYLAQNGSLFPPTSSSGLGWEVSNEGNPGDFMETLVNSKTISKVPLDPKNDNTMYYQYYLYNAGYASCDVSKGRFAVFQIIDIETSGRPYKNDPGFSCPDRNWNTEADYTFGIFENG